MKKGFHPASFKADGRAPEANAVNYMDRAKEAERKSLTVLATARSCPSQK